MKRFAIALTIVALPFGSAVAACPCTYTLTQEQQDALVNALAAARQWNAVMAAGSTNPRAFLLEQREVEALFQDLGKQERDAAEKTKKAPEDARPPSSVP